MNLEVVQTRSTANGKNFADATVVVAAMDLLNKGQHDIFVIVSSDSDFTERLREAEKDVLVIGDNPKKQNVRGSVQNACNVFIGTGQIKEMNNVLRKPREALPLLKSALLE